MITSVIRREIFFRAAIPNGIRSLAVRYEVSPKAMELRLVNLGFISPVE